MELVQNTFAQMEISYPNILHNYNYFRSKLKPSTKLLVLIKANAYGHGAVEFARIMEKAGADYFAVAHTIEGIELKKAGIATPVIILSGGTDYYKEAVEYSLEPAMPNIESLRKFDSMLEQSDIKEYPIHIKIDTGMHRLGFMEKEIPALLEFLKTHPRIRVKSIYTHLAASDEPKHDEFTLGQLALYRKLASQIDAVLDYKPIHHALNSAGIERFTQFQFDMVRLGIGIYGISAVDPALLKPAARLTCKILQVKELTPEDGTVGYGRHGKLREGINRIATLPLGYADGIDRHLGRGKACFCVKGQLVPTIGNICMDQCMIDVTGTDAQPGDIVTIFGDKPQAVELARILDTIPYEIFTSVAHRVKRTVIAPQSF